MVRRYNFIVAAVICLICLGVFYSLAQVRKIPDVAVSDPTSLVYSVDKVKKNKWYVTVSGWAIDRGKHTWRHANSIVLSNGAESYVLPTKLLARRDVEEMFASDGKLYTQSGFFARGFRLFIPKGEYRVLIKNQRDEGTQIVDTGRTVRL